MAPLLFFDPLCPRPYGEESLREAGLAGTEASTVRIAAALDAWVAQHNRTEAQGRYRPPGAVAHLRHVVVLRDPRALQAAARLFPGARLTLWVHDRIEPGSSRARWFARAAGAAPPAAGHRLRLGLPAPAGRSHARAAPRLRAPGGAAHL